MWKRAGFISRPKAIFAVQQGMLDSRETITAISGIIRDGELRVDSSMAFGETGQTAYLNVVIEVHDIGGTVRSWDDIRVPVAEIENRRQLE